jgi:hypothetical protein
LKIMHEKKSNCIFMLCTNFWTRQQAVVRLPDPTVHETETMAATCAASAATLL